MTKKNKPLKNQNIHHNLKVNLKVFSFFSASQRGALMSKGNVCNTLWSKKGLSTLGPSYHSPAQNGWFGSAHWRSLPRPRGGFALPLPRGCPSPLLGEKWGQLGVGMSLYLWWYGRRYQHKGEIIKGAPDMFLLEKCVFHPVWRRYWKGWL